MSNQLPVSTACTAATAAEAPTVSTTPASAPSITPDAPSPRVDVHEPSLPLRVMTSSTDVAPPSAAAAAQVEVLPHTVEGASSARTNNTSTLVVNTDADRPNQQQHPPSAIVVTSPLLWTPSTMRVESSNPFNPQAQGQLQRFHQRLRGLESSVELPFGVADGSACFPDRNLLYLPEGVEPTPSYFVQPKKTWSGVGAESPLSLAPHDRKKKRSSSAPYQPLKEICSDLPQLLEGRAMEQYRFFTRRPTPMRIPIYDQACLKYLFTDSFDDKVDPAEWVTALSFVISILVNAGSAISNLVEAANGVGSEDPNNPLDQQWIIELSKVVFAVEFAVIFGMLIGLVVTIVHAACHKNVGTDLATDVVALGQRIAGFSSIKVVGWVSPAFASRLIMPHVKAATNWRKRIRVVLYILAYLGGCALATATVTLKVTQIAFTGTTPIGDWTSAQWLSLIGFVMNLAKVDDSYFTETKVLLCAVHEHFCSPGEPTDEFPSSETLFSRALRYLNIPREAYYEYFEVVFDYHSALPEPKRPAVATANATCAASSPNNTADAQNIATVPGSPTATTASPSPPKRNKRNPGRAVASIFTARAPSDTASLWAQFLRFMNFFTFILKIDNNLLRKFLQMSSSPLLFYEQGRKSFQQAYEENDIVGMNLALWRSDPEDRNTVQWSLRHEQCFNIVFRCDEGIRVLRPDELHDVVVAGHERTAAMEASGSTRLPLSSMEMIHLLASGRHIVAASTKKTDGQHSTPFFFFFPPRHNHQCYCKRHPPH
ncbi:membrane-associated protein, putative [Bodo saltans]|uniref:Membrane-associated protein, putative n=1 Tax=Bodo saltans TaxID=75058 RepID=A0A0S4J3G7_BODSA|nr:membrane-associated protein, putative [Bodo saltans]|eukprot:CUG36612.1 membrane-associated protein, putative [Bodo saltans]